MTSVRITESELARDVPAVMEKIRQGSEVIIEKENHETVAVISPPHRSGRLLSESIQIAKARGSKATLDQGFMNDVEEGIAGRSHSWEPPSWD